MKGGVLELAQSTLGHQILNIKFITLEGKRQWWWRGLEVAGADSSKQGFLFVCFQELVFKGKRGRPVLG